MEPKNELNHSYLVGVVKALDFWSTKSLQGFLGSSLAHDFAEAVQRKDFDFKKAGTNLVNKYPGFDFCRGGVSIPQTSRLISMAPNKNPENWSDFFNLISLLGNNSKLFEHGPCSWVDRDAIRVAIGLESINKIYKQEYPVYTHKTPHDVFFRKTGHCAVWGGLPVGYRYAKPEEVPTQAIKNLDLVVVYIHNFGWARLGTEGEDVKHDGVVAHNFFHNNVFYVPLIKIK